MPHLRWMDLARNAGIFATYVLLAWIGLLLALDGFTITIFWPASGFALAIMLLYGPRGLPGILAGGIVAGRMATDHVGAAVMLGMADTVEPLLAWWLLTRRMAFDSRLRGWQDFFRLVLLAGPMAAVAGMAIGTTALWASGVLPGELMTQTAMRWWMGDVLGIALLTPLILIWRQRPQQKLKPAQALEWAAMAGLTLLVGQMVFADWFMDVSGTPASLAWLVPFLIWAGLRGGRHVTATLLPILFIQAMWSASHGIGRFAHDIAQTGLVNFWMFGMALAIGGMALAIVASEIHTIQREWHRLHNGMASSLNEVYQFDADSLRFSFANRGAMQNLGYSMEALKRLTPLDLQPEFTAQSFAELVAPLRRRETALVKFETVHRRKDGTLYPVEVHLQLCEDGEERYFQAVILDISQRHRAEKQLRLAAQVFENGSDGIMITDAEQHIVSVNRAFSAITGYAEHEVLGGKPKILASGIHDDRFYRTIRQALLEDGRWQGEIWNRRKSGELYPEWLSISVVRDERGNIANYIGVFSDISERKAAENFLRHQAQHDFLTNLPNRTLLHDRFQQLLARARRDRLGFALLYLDLDDFKPVNDTHGHRIGDLLLQAVAERLSGSMRQSDTICRLGGDEFAILTPGIATQEEAASLAGKLRETVQAPYRIEGIGIRISVSLGIALYPEHGNDEEALMAHADAAMYRCKHGNRHAARAGQ